MVSRQVYIIDDWPHASAKANTRRDRKLLHDGRYVFERLGADSPEADFQVAPIAEIIVQTLEPDVSSITFLSDISIRPTV